MAAVVEARVSPALASVRARTAKIRPAKTQYATRAVKRVAATSGSAPSRVPRQETGARASIKGATVVVPVPQPTA